MCTVHTIRTLSIQYVRNVYCEQKQNIFHTSYQNYVLCTQNTFKVVHHICVLSTETKQFPDGTSKLPTVHRNRTLSRRYIKNAYCVQKQNTFQTVHQKF